MPTDDAGTHEPIHPPPKDMTMNAKTLIASALFVAFAGAGSAFAQEATQDFQPSSLLSTKSRAEVHAEFLAAKRAGTLQTHNYAEASAAPAAASTLTRAQVIAEAREALRLGATDANEAEIRVATPAQQQLIRAAGLRALDRDMAQASK
jgi:hypothetical protein